MSEQTKYGDLISSRSHLPKFRMYDEFPAGDECDLEPGDVPDTEDGFYVNPHYEDRRDGRSDPEVTDDVVDHLLNESVVREAPGNWENDRYLFQAELYGDDRDYEWTLVVADDGQDSDPRFALITIFSNYHGSVGTTNKYRDRLEQRRGDR